MLPRVGTFLVRTGIRKIRQRFLAGGMCEWHVCSNTQQRQMQLICAIYHALYCGEIPSA